MSAWTELLGPHVAYALRTPGRVPVDRLHPIEAAQATRAVDKRRLELAAGRDAAREALVQLGLPPCAIPARPDRSPEWPEGVVGSITHTSALCAAVAAKRDLVRAIGIDAEPDEPLERELWASIATPDELAALEAMDEGGRRARWIFCAKEAAYKCQYPLSGLMLGFADLVIRWSNEGERVHGFEATYRRDAGPFRSGDRIPGLLSQIDGHVVAVCKLLVDSG